MEREDLLRLLNETVPPPMFEYMGNGSFRAIYQNYEIWLEPILHGQKYVMFINPKKQSDEIIQELPDDYIGEAVDVETSQSAQQAVQGEPSQAVQQFLITPSSWWAHGA